MKSILHVEGNPGSTPLIQPLGQNHRLLEPRPGGAAFGEAASGKELILPTN